MAGAGAGPHGAAQFAGAGAQGAAHVAGPHFGLHGAEQLAGPQAAGPHGAAQLAGAGAQAGAAQVAGAAHLGAQLGAALQHWGLAHVRW